MTNSITKLRFSSFRYWFTGIVTFLIWGLLAWQYFHDSIPSHHFLADKNMPLVSNIWGAIVIPALTWFLLWMIEKRLYSKSETIPFPYQTLAGFTGALIFGIALAFAIRYDFNTFSSNIPYILFILALFFPTHRSECFLGFVLGLTYSIGGVLPVVVGSIFLLLSAAIHLGLRPLLVRFYQFIASQF